MKHLRLIIRTIIAVLLALTIAGIIILIVNKNLDVLDTSYEIIAFSLAASGIIMAVVSQIDLHQSEKEFRKVLADVERLNRDHDADDTVDAEFQQKLDTLLKLDREIVRKLAQKEK